jgi:hypothetical protein
MALERIKTVASENFGFWQLYFGVCGVKIKRQKPEYFGLAMELFSNIHSRLSFLSYPFKHLQKLYVINFI